MIFTDVIGSKSTTKRIISSISHTKNIKLAPIINATEDPTDYFEINNFKVQLVSLINKPLKFYNTKPAEWPYSSILTVDSDTNRLKRNLINIQGPIWDKNYTEKGFSVDFISQIILPNKGIIKSHFVSRNKHITYLFDVPNIIIKHSTELIDCIIADFTNLKTLDTELESKSVHTIVYPAFNPGLAEFTLELSKKFTVPLMQ